MDDFNRTTDDDYAERIADADNAEREGALANLDALDEFEAEVRETIAAGWTGDEPAAGEVTPDLRNARLIAGEIDRIARIAAAPGTASLTGLEPDKPDPCEETRREAIRVVGEQVAIAFAMVGATPDECRNAAHKAQGVMADALATVIRKGEE